MPDGNGCGFYLETWGGERYTVVGWWLRWCDAEKERKRRMEAGSWAGKPPRVVAAGR